MNGGVRAGRGGAGTAGRGAPEVPDTALAFADLPAGAAFGTLVHGILEVLDTRAADLGDEVELRCAQAVSRHPMAGVPVAALAPAILAALRTPLGPLAAGRTLAGSHPPTGWPSSTSSCPWARSAARTLADVAALLRAHLPADDPLARYPDQLAAPGLGSATLRGYLSGSIDAVLRVPAGAGPVPGPRYLVVDYKTNLLRDAGAPGLERLAWGYRPEVLPAAMIGAHYPLQALLYSAALHRYLRWRLPDYDPHADLGGVLYLFLRGMAGPGTPRCRPGVACGVFSWAPPADLVVAAVRPARRAAAMILTSHLGLGPLHPFHAAGILGVPDVHVSAALLRVGGQRLETASSSRRRRRAGCGTVRAGPAWRVGVHRPCCRPGDVDPELEPDHSSPTRGLAPADPATGPWIRPSCHGRTRLSGWPRPAPTRWSRTASDRPPRPAPAARRVAALPAALLARRAGDRRRPGPPGTDDRRSIRCCWPRHWPACSPSEAPDRQRLAAATVALRRATIVAGGPGTGKTTTVARIIALLRDVEGPP